MRTLPLLLFLFFLRICALAQLAVPGTAVPGTISSTGSVSSAHLQAEIEALLGQSETELLRGLRDPGVDLNRLITEKALDEAVKALASAAVYAPLAEKILSLYHQLQKQRLASELGKLRRVLRDGQERLNKIRYQSLKIKLAAQQTHRQPDGALVAGPHQARVQTALQTLPDAGRSALGQLGGGETFRILREDFDAFTNGRQHLSYDAYLTIQTLIQEEAVRAKHTAALARGAATWTSPYQRLQLLRSAEREARVRTNTLVDLAAATQQALTYQKRRRLESRLYQRQGVRPYSVYR